MTQAQLADAVGISAPYLHQIEKGIRNLTLERQEAIAKALGVKPGDLVDFSGSDEDIKAVLDAYDRASTAERAMIMSWARAILSQDQGD